MRCSHCHEIVEDNDQYCSMCGTKIERCPYCKGVVKEGSRYCLYCGHLLDGTYNHEHVQTHKGLDVIDEGYKEKKKTNWIVIALSIALLIGCTGVAVNYLTTGPQIEVNDPKPIQKEENPGNILVNNKLPFSTVTGNVNIIGSGYVCEDYVYIIDELGSIVRMDHHLDNQEVIIDDNCSYIQVTDKNIYYVNENQSLCVADLDGKNRDVVLDKDVYYVVYKDGYIYYQLDEDKESIYSYKIDESKHTKLNDHQSYNINVCDDIIYYSSTDGIYKMALDGSHNEKIVEMQVYNLIYKDNALYFTDQRNQILRYDLKSDMTSVLTTNSTSYFNIINDYLFYIDKDAYLYRYDMSSKESQRIYNGQVDQLTVFDGCLIVNTFNYNDEYLIAIDFNGENQLRLFIENDENFI